MQNIINELNASIIEYETKLDVIKTRLDELERLITKYSYNIEKLKDLDKGYNISNSMRLLFVFPSFNENLKQSDKMLLSRFKTYSINAMISINKFNSLKLEERRNLRMKIDTMIACNKPNKAKLGELNIKIQQISVGISGLTYGIKEARIIKINELINQNKSVGNDKLAVLYNFLDNDGIKLKVEHPLYFDSSSIKNMLKELDALKVTKGTMESEFENIKWLNNAVVEDYDISTSSNYNIWFPIIYSSEESLKWFESVIIRGYINKLETVTLRGLQDELKTIKLEESLTLTKLNAKREKLRNVRHLPEWRRMQAYEKMLSLTASSTNPGASTA